MNAPETTVKTGKIMLVGLGPGSQDHLTARARAAIAEADTVIGYVTYIRLVADLVEGKEVIKKSMTEELDRAIEALDRASQGKKVALGFVSLSLLALWRLGDVIKRRSHVRLPLQNQ